MSLMNDTKSNSFSKKIESMPDDNDLSSIIKHELESILEELGNDEKVENVKNKIATAFKDINSTVEVIKNYRETLDSFSNNLEKIIKDWDSTADDVSHEQLGN